MLSPIQLIGGGGGGGRGFGNTLNVFVLYCKEGNDNSTKFGNFS